MNRRSSARWAGNGTIRRCRIFPRRGPPVGAKFALVLAVLVPCLLAVAWVGARAQDRMRAAAEGLYEDNVEEIQHAAQVEAGLAEAGRTALQIIPIGRPERLSELSPRLYGRLIPAVDEGIDELRADDNDSVEDALVGQLAADWQQLKATFDLPEFRATTQGATDDQTNDRLAEEVEASLSSAASTLAQLRAHQTQEAGDAIASVERYDDRANRQMTAIIVASLLVGVGSVVWLIRDIVPRIRRYSRFAADVAAGELSHRLRPAGHDELSQLGRTLDEMVDRRVAQLDDDRAQAEFSEALQVAADEEEAHHLLKRHLERSLPGSCAVVLNRNNSANRLQAMTPLPEPSELSERLAAAPPPRACMAVRLGRPHHENADRDSLLTCGLCAHTAASSTCQPLLVGGEVIGAVLVQAEQTLDTRRVAEPVVLAAPVLANLRNLAIAEQRALTDALTGLPNQRASNDTTRRMTAQASRSVEPLAAILLDLDHFKHINDVYGHDKGDEVLAAVGAALASAVRDSDFAGRYGGEEFLVLLPATTADAALRVAEHLRRVIASITIPGVDQPITASLGVAVLPDHAVDPVTLVRQADRALYAAKAAGRNRTATLDATNPTENGQRPRAPEVAPADSPATTYHDDGVRRTPGEITNEHGRSAPSAPAGPSSPSAER